MSLLDLISGEAQETVKTAAEAEGDFDNQLAEMYKVGWNLFEAHLMKAAQEMEEGEEGKKTESKSESPEQFKERRKAELMDQMQKSPEKKEELKKEMEGGK